MWGDPNVVRFIGGKPFSEQQTWLKLLAYAGHWALMGFGYWAVEEKESSRFIGELGFADFKRELEPSIKGTPELGWVLVSDARGKGYATEALRAAVKWGDEHLESRRTVCLIDPGNLPSIRVAEKCGYNEVRRTVYKDESVILFARQSRAMASTARGRG